MRSRRAGKRLSRARSRAHTTRELTPLAHSSDAIDASTASEPTGRTTARHTQ